MECQVVAVSLLAEAVIQSSAEEAASQEDLGACLEDQAAEVIPFEEAEGGQLRAVTEVAEHH